MWFFCQIHFITFKKNENRCICSMSTDADDGSQQTIRLKPHFSRNLGQYLIADYWWHLIFDAWSLDISRILVAVQDALLSLLTVQFANNLLTVQFAYDLLTRGICPRHQQSLSRVSSSQSLLEQLLSSNQLLLSAAAAGPTINSCNNWFYICSTSLVHNCWTNCFCLLLYQPTTDFTSALCQTNFSGSQLLNQLLLNLLLYHQPLFQLPSADADALPTASLYQASSADADAEPSMRADTQGIEIKIWAEHLEVLTSCWTTRHLAALIHRVKNVQFDYKSVTGGTIARCLATRSTPHLW